MRPLYNAPDKIGNAISKFYIKKDDIIPGIPNIKSSYDKLEVIQICLNSKSKEKLNEEDALQKFCAMLNVLFSDDMQVDKKIKILQNNYEVRMTSQIEEELDSMSGLGQAIAENSEKIGKAKMLIEFMKCNNCSLTGAMKMHGIPKEEQPEYETLVQQINSKTAAM